MDRNAIQKAIKSIRCNALTAVAEIIKIRVDESVYPDGLSKELLEDRCSESLELTLQKYLLPRLNEISPSDSFSKLTRDILGWKSHDFNSLSPALWDLTSTWSPRDKWYEEAFLLIPSYLMKRPDTTILDVGSGTGIVPRILNQLGFIGKVIAVEPEKGWCNHLKSLGFPNLCIVNETLGNASSLVDPNSCNLVTSLMVGHHIKNKNTYFDFISSSLKRNGLFIHMDKMEKWSESEETKVCNYLFTSSDLIKLHAVGPFKQQPHPSSVPEYLVPPHVSLKCAESAGLNPKSVMILSEKICLFQLDKQDLRKEELTFFSCVQNLKGRIRKVYLEGTHTKTPENPFHTILNSSDEVEVQPRYKLPFNEYLEKHLGVKEIDFLVYNCDKLQFTNTTKGITFSAHNSHDKHRALLNMAKIFISMLEKTNNACRDEIFQAIFKYGLLLSQRDFDNQTLTIIDSLLKRKKKHDGDVIPLFSNQCINSSCDRILIISARTCDYFSSDIGAPISVIGLAVLSPLSITACEIADIEQTTGKLRALLEVAADPVAEMEFYPEASVKFDRIGEERGKFAPLHVVKKKIREILRILDRGATDDISEGIAYLDKMQRDLDFIHSVQDGNRIAVHYMDHTCFVDFISKVIDEFAKMFALPSISLTFSDSSNFECFVSKDAIKLIICEIVVNLREHANISKVVMKLTLDDSFIKLDVQNASLNRGKLENIIDIQKRRGKPRMHGFYVIEMAQKSLGLNYWNATVDDQKNYLTITYPIAKRRIHNNA
jgi:SAM-dependent methyltransferase